MISSRSFTRRWSMRQTRSVAPIARSGTDVWASIVRVTRLECVLSAKYITARKKATFGPRRDTLASFGTITPAWMVRISEILLLILFVVSYDFFMLFMFPWYFSGAVYDITEWAGCQRKNLKHLRPNSHNVQYRIVLGKQGQAGGSSSSHRRGHKTSANNR